MSAFCQLWLTCADKVEATKIAKALLEQKLIVCAKQAPVSADFLWKGEVDHNEEVLLIMDSREDLFEAVEAVVKKLHSYETFVLHAIAFAKISKAAKKWAEAELRS